MISRVDHCSKLMSSKTPEYSSKSINVRDVSPPVRFAKCSCSHRRADATPLLETPLSMARSNFCQPGIHHVGV